MNHPWIALAIASIVLGMAIFPTEVRGQCSPVLNLTTYKPYHAPMQLRFTAPQAGSYGLYSTPSGTPGPFPSDWSLETTLEVDSGAIAVWADSLTVAAYKLYVAAYLCSDSTFVVSNRAAYFQLQANGGIGTNVCTPFGLPFKFWYAPNFYNALRVFGTESRKPSSIVGWQAMCATLVTADRVTRQDNGQFGYLDGNGCVYWRGTLETSPAAMEPGRAYWYVNKSGVLRNIYLAGEADTTAIGIPTVTVQAPTAPFTATPTPYSWRDPRIRSRATLNLLAHGFAGGSLYTADRVAAQIGGAIFFFRTPDNTWQGSLLTIVPGQAYWIQNKHVGHPWSYTYNASGTP